MSQQSAVAIADLHYCQSSGPEQAGVLPTTRTRTRPSGGPGDSGPGSRVQVQVQRPVVQVQVQGPGAVTGAGWIWSRRCNSGPGPLGSVTGEPALRAGRLLLSSSSSRPWRLAGGRRGGPRVPGNGDIACAFQASTCPGIASCFCIRRQVATGAAPGSLLL
jgi:hypothetical protein